VTYERWRAAWRRPAGMCRGIPTTGVRVSEKLRNWQLHGTDSFAGAGRRLTSHLERRMP
jgi:hypothetical protein